MTDTSLLGTALLATQQTIKNPHLDSTNPHFGSKFASLGAHLDAIVPVANTNGLVVVQEPSNINGTPALTTRVIHAGTFEFIESVMPLAVDKPGPQGQGSALTYARRYALASIFGVVGEPDDDGHAASSPRAGGKPGTTAVPAVAAEGIPSPSAPAGTPPATTDAAAMVEKAQQAQKNRPAPADGGDPAQVEIMFGKNKGKKLGELSANQVRWYAEVWEPNPDYANDTDRRLKMAARLLSGLAVEELHTAAAAAGPVDDTDGIPFGPVIW